MADEVADEFFPVKFGSRTIKFYPLALGWMRRNGAILKKLREGPTDVAAAIESGEKLGVLISILHASAKRGDPSVTEEDVEAVADVSNMNALMSFVMAGSGMKPVPAERASDPTSPQTGGESTPQ